MTHIDPFAPADSPQHPANFGTAALSPNPPDESEEFEVVTDAAAQEELDPEEAQRLHLANYYPEEGDDASAPSLAQLRARATLARPGSGANKAEWVQYALTIRHDLSPEDADGLTVAALKELKP